MKMKGSNLKLLMKKNIRRWFLLKQKKEKLFWKTKKKRDEKKAKLLDELKQNDLQMKHINSNIN